MSRSGAFADSARRAAARDPFGTAVVDGRTRWSWAALDARADAVAGRLERAGIGIGDRVALVAPPSAMAIAALHGIARLGAVAVPMGTGLTEAEVAASSAVTDPQLVVVGAGMEAAGAVFGKPVLVLDRLAAVGRRRTGVSAATRETAAPPRAGPKAPAVIVLTSGTTGRPKAAVLSNAALVASAHAWLGALPAPTGWLLALGLGHVAGLGVVWRAALAGVPLMVLARPDPGAILRALARDPSPSHVSLVPTMLARLLDEADDRPPPPTLRAVLLGGGTIPHRLVSQAIRVGWPVVPTYGLTEAGSGVTALSTAEAMDHPESAGHPLPGVEIAIADPDGEGAGEIVVRSPALFSGYLGDAAATAASITDAGWLRTGDLGRLDRDGRLTVLDRRTDRIVRGGENVSPAEVEAILLDHPAVADAGVIARRDETFGHVPVAAIVVRGNAGDPGDEALARHCRQRLARFKVPAAFIRLEALPRTASGKLRRAELRTRLDQMAADPRLGRAIERPDGTKIAYRTVGAGHVPLVLLPGTLSSAAQLGAFARALAESGAFTVHTVDRRGTGESRLADPRPLDIEVHVADLVAVADAEGCAAAAVVGVSFGGVLALEFAARVPGRASAVVAWEPPYGAVADGSSRAAFAAIADATERAHRSGGRGAAAEAFMRGVAGDAAWDRLGDRTRAALELEGDGALVDGGLRGLDPAGLGRIRGPVTILTGNASDAVYGPIADALVGLVSDGEHVTLAGMTHTSPITDPVAVAAVVTERLLSAAAAAAAADRLGPEKKEQHP